MGGLCYCNCGEKMVSGPLPGRATEPGESLEDTARRESLETGLLAGESRSLTVCSGLEFSHVYPNGDRIENVVAVYHGAKITGELRADGEEGLDLRYFDAARRRMQRRALAALASYQVLERSDRLG